jgi:hypothetical protein
MILVKRSYSPVKLKWFILAAIFATLTVTAFSEDINGAWTAEIPDRLGVINKVTFELNVKGDELTGAAFGFQEEERPILDGKFKGDKISFTLKEHVGSRTYTYIYDGKISGDTIKLRVVMIGPGSRPKEYLAKKVNP